MRGIMLWGIFFLSIAVITFILIFFQFFSISPQHEDGLLILSYIGIALFLIGLIGGWSRGE